MDIAAPWLATLWCTWQIDSMEFPVAHGRPNHAGCVQALLASWSQFVSICPLLIAVTKFIWVVAADCIAWCGIVCCMVLLLHDKRWDVRVSRNVLINDLSWIHQHQGLSHVLGQDWLLHDVSLDCGILHLYQVQER